jgi:pullulanase/glycogen debranching enzyme
MLNRFSQASVLALGFLLAATALPARADTPATAAAAPVAPAAPAISPLDQLRAEIRGARAIWFHMGKDRPLNVADYKLTDGQGKEIALSSMLPNTAKEALLVPAVDLDITRAYYLEAPKAGAAGARTKVRFDGWFRTLYSDKPLGAEIAANGAHTDFRVFAPRATGLKLYLYNGKDATPAQARQVVSMVKDAQGVWEARLPGDLHGTWYDFTVHGPADPGNFFYETKPVHISDPYARVAVDNSSKARVWRKIEPSPGVRGGRPKMEDVIAYEVHVQDFADLLPVPEALKGTMTAMATPGLRNKQGQPIGIDHIAKLGVNVVHLLPMQEFFHYSDEEWTAAFKDNELMKSVGSSTENYDWGYRTTHAFASEHGAEREQFRDMIKAFHARGIAVIVDIVPNHTGEDMDSRNHFLNWNVLDRQYYYRTNNEGNHIGVFGNEVKTEDRPMVQRWLIDQAKSLISEFGVDGFRIDLAGQLDEQSLIRMRQELGPDVIIYGEPWIDVSDPVMKANPDWDWYKEDAPITFFQDDTRNALVGSPFRLVDQKTDRGWAGGNAPQRAEVMRALENKFAEESKSPNQGINYTDIHDNWTLADRFALKDWDGRKGVDQAPYKIATGLLLTSLGPIVLHAGSEFMRSKGVAPIKHQVLQTATGPIYYKGREDTYNIASPNHFVWDNVGKRPSKDSPNDYANMQAWWAGMIALRNSEIGKVFRLGTVPPAGHYRFITPDNQSVLGYVVGNKVFVATNVGDSAASLDNVTLPAGNWRLVANNDRVDHLRGVRGPDARLTGGANATTIALPPTSFRIWVRQ